MKIGILKVLTFLVYACLAIVGFVVLYIGVGYLLAKIPVNKDNLGTSHGIDIYILTNGVHTDLVLPIKSIHIDWSKEVKFENIPSKDTLMNYLAFGWGDKGFYLETPSWSELKFSVGFKAMFYLSTSAMHTTFYKEMKVGNTCKKITINDADYLNLVNYIKSSFQTNSAGEFINIKNHSYGPNDSFYEANGVYNLFHTCNSWANDGLKVCGLRACLWTPFDKGIFYQYRNQ